MKADKILFGMACVGMGLIVHSAYNKSTLESDSGLKSIKTKTLFENSVRLKQALNNDTLYLSNAVKTDSLKLLKKVSK